MVIVLLNTMVTMKWRSSHDQYCPEAHIQVLMFLTTLSAFGTTGPVWLVMEPSIPLPV